uniref:Uncharacterized protein n=1 Tax=Arundo donax TaxID=35708 RepID=A0A0A9F9I1_ARUDO
MMLWLQYAFNHCQAPSSNLHNYFPFMPA